MQDFFTYDPLLNGSKGLVFIGDRILVYRRDSKPKLYPLYLDLPGGGKEEGETPFQTFKREVAEEFGLTIHESDVKYVRRYPSTIVEGEYAYFPVARLPQEAEVSIQFGNEGLEYLLLPVDDFLSATDVWPGLQEKASDYIESLKEPTASPVHMHKAGGVILRDRKFLVTRSLGKDFFIAPGGKLENGETPEEALKRELFEEILININPSTLESLGTYYAEAAGKEGVMLEMHVFKVNDYEGEPTPSAEVEEIMWINSQTTGINIGSIFKHSIMPLLKQKDLID